MPVLQPGMVSVVHTAGDLVGWHPHIHAIASRGGWPREGEWVPVAFVGTGEAERLFQHRVITLLRDEGLLSEEQIELLLSWRHSGFSVHNTVRVAAGDTAGIERLGRYLLRSPVAVERLELDPSTGEALYQPKQHHESGKPPVERFEPAERRQARRTWAHLICCVYEVDPLVRRKRDGNLTTWSQGAESSAA